MRRRAQLLLHLARVLQKKGDFPTAEKHVKAAEEATKTAPLARRQHLRAESWLQMGILKQLEGKYEKSFELIEKARKTFGMTGDVVAAELGSSLQRVSCVILCWLPCYFTLDSDGDDLAF